MSFSFEQYAERLRRYEELMGERTVLTSRVIDRVAVPLDHNRGTGLLVLTSMLHC
jgi:hypothetical protein